ncbi:hypothetical protein MST27_14265 [Pseudomonas sp. PS1]|uniref:Secreted protein n=1 Tax=Stutzerimonas marianensis TaxID=2929513 RepID=A0A9X1W6J8_9GAMM|nr:hypothetical protein [Pseudomonas marianensis]MCJ0974534.1 hypothetical protein [Pseudomonas marianensis]
MRTYATRSMVSLIGTLTIAGWAVATPLESVDPLLAQQGPAPADRSLGNGSMGTGEGIERLPDDEAEGDGDGGQSRYEQPEHGDTDTDMEHRPRRTLGDEDE